MWRNREQPLFFAEILVGCVCAAGARRAACEADAEIRVEPPVHPDGERVAEDRLDQPVPEVPRRESVTMMQVHPLASHGQFRRVEVQMHAQFGAEEVPHPEVVVSRHIVDGNAAVRERLNGRKCPVEPFRDHRIRIRTRNRTDHRECIIPRCAAGPHRGTTASGLPSPAPPAGHPAQDVHRK